MRKTNSFRQPDDQNKTCFQTTVKELVQKARECGGAISLWHEKFVIWVQVGPTQPPTQQSINKKALEEWLDGGLDKEPHKPPAQSLKQLRYQFQYEGPLQSLFNEIIQDIKAIACEGTEQWEKEIRTAGPSRLDFDYWIEGVLDRCSHPVMREGLRQKIILLLETKAKAELFLFRQKTKKQSSTPA
jgi:hypothetical protein